jgi:nucleoside-diphosphate-sugar epimerase
MVIGSRGTVGRSLLPELEAAGIPCVGLTSTEIDLSAGDSPEKLMALIRPGDVLVMLAALTPDRGRDAQTFLRNVMMAANLAKAVEKTDWSQLIYLSSDAVYDPAASLVHEGTPTSAGDLYGIMHVARERILAEAAQKAGGRVFLILRPCALYGSGDSHNSYGPNRFLRMAKYRRKITLFGQGEEQRDHVFIADLCRLLRLVVERLNRGVLNVATGKAVSFGDLARQIQSLVDGPVEIECLPRSSPVTHRHFDVTALVRAFPDFSFTPPKTGLAASLAGIQENPQR